MIIARQWSNGLAFCCGSWYYKLVLTKKSMCDWFRTIECFSFWAMVCSDQIFCRLWCLAPYYGSVGQHGHTHCLIRKALFLISSTYFLQWQLGNVWSSELCLKNLDKSYSFENHCEIICHHVVGHFWTVVTVDILQRNNRMPQILTCWFF